MFTTITVKKAEELQKYVAHFETHIICNQGCVFGSQNSLNSEESKIERKGILNEIVIDGTTCSGLESVNDLYVNLDNEPVQVKKKTCSNEKISPLLCMKPVKNTTTETKSKLKNETINARTDDDSKDNKCHFSKSLENVEKSIFILDNIDPIRKEIVNIYKYRLPKLTSSCIDLNEIGNDLKNENINNTKTANGSDAFNRKGYALRAVSSPSLIEPSNGGIKLPLEEAACNGFEININGTSFGPTSGVLHKFKKSLTNLNKKNQNSELDTLPNTVNINVDSGAGAISSTSNLFTHPVSNKYRFSPLIWRYSKERRKSKHDRRDKCNSGDSGIQIELENEEHNSKNLVIISNAKKGYEGNKFDIIRRTNSAKSVGDSLNGDFENLLAFLNSKEVMLKGVKERLAPQSLALRSISQPNGLDNFGLTTRTEDDCSDSDSVASHEASSHYYPIYAEVLYEFKAAGPQELGLEPGAIIEVLRKEVGPWWFGRIRKEDASLVHEILDPEMGWFPKDFVRIIASSELDQLFYKYIQQQQKSSSNQKSNQQSDVSQESQEKLTESQMQSKTKISINAAEKITIDNNTSSNVTTIIIDSPTSLPEPSSFATRHITSPSNTPLAPSMFNLMLNSSDLLRRSAIRELLDTEVNYVNLLHSICEGYLPAMSKRIDIFTPNSIRLIFSNIVAIYKFQRKFLNTLRKGIEQNQIAKVFLKTHKGFLCYSTYCNAYPRALIELETYDHVKEAKIIMENCRESENLTELPLSAHLLAPVQRICRYPLHLTELIKTAGPYTEDVCKDLLNEVEAKDISQIQLPDTKPYIETALEAMKSITEAVNEGKRHSETISRHQSSFQNFKGPPLHFHSTRFFLQIDATRQKQNLWNSSYTLFLFDNQLIYCKRDLLKRSHFIYKGRIFLDRCRIVNVRDGKMFGHTIKNSLRIYCEARDKWYDFSFRSANRKHRFLSTLALERQFGGKSFYISEMTGYEYNYEERPAMMNSIGTAGNLGEYFSDQSDCELQDRDNGHLRSRGYAYDGTTGTSASGESSVPDSPAKSSKKLYIDTLPKKSQSKTEITGEPTLSNCNSATNDLQTASLGRRRFGNWFRRPKSSACTPNQSPTHKTSTDTLNSAIEAPSALVTTQNSQQET